MGVVKYRVDGRMLHGQTCSAWGAKLHVDSYIVVNEKVANDNMQVTLLELAAMGNALDVVSPAEAKEILETEDFQGDRTMVVFKNLEDAVEIVKLGYKFDELCIGGMYNEAGKNRVKYGETLFANEDDKKAFAYLESQGIRLTYQVVPDYREKMVKDLVGY